MMKYSKRISAEYCVFVFNINYLVSSLCNLILMFMFNNQLTKFLGQYEPAPAYH